MRTLSRLRIKRFKRFAFLKLVDLKCKYNSPKDATGIGTSLQRLSIGDIYSQANESLVSDIEGKSSISSSFLESFGADGNTPLTRKKSQIKIEKWGCTLSTGMNTAYC